MGKIKTHFFSLSFLLFFFTHSTTQCIIIGSESAVSVQPAASFPASDSDNTMLGFGWFKNGFSLQDATTACTFNSVYPVSGTVDMAGGTLALLQDITFHNVTTLNGLGTVLGNNYAIDFCTSITALPANTQTFKNTNIFLNSDVLVTSTITLQGNCTFNGRGNALIMSANGALVIDSNAQVAFEEMEIKGIEGTNIQCADATGRIILSDIAWEQTADFAFLKGSIFMRDAVTFMGTATFFYSSSQTSTLGSNSTWLLTNGLHLNIGRDPITGNEPLAFTDSTSVLKLSNCGYDIAPTGITLKKGTVFVDSNVNAHISSSSFATGIMLGTGSPADDFTVYFSPGCSISHYGHLMYNNSIPTLFKSSTNTTKLIRTANSSVLANTNFEMPEMTVQLVSDSVPPLVVTPGASLSFNQTTIVLPSVSFDITGIQYNPWTYVLPGNGSMNFSKGSLPLYLIIQNGGNQIMGNGSIDGTITLADASAQLLFGITGYVGNTLTLNGGTVMLERDLKLYNAGMIVGPGMVNLSNQVLQVNSDVTVWPAPINWVGAGGTISLDEKISLASTWTVQGTCIIDGKNNELEFLSGGKIVVQPNSQLYLKNLRLQSIEDVNIQCVDDTGVVVLDNIYWTQTDDYYFTKGSLKIINEVDLVGSYTFFYESTQTSTIEEKSTLTARDHLNLSIGKRQVVGAQEPLVLTDSTSLIIVDNAQWSIVGDGMRLTKGRVICSDDVLVDIASTNSLQGLKLGNLTSAGDVTFEFRPGTTVRMPRGHVVCDWVANNNVKSQSTTAQLIRNAANAFYCSNDIVLSNLTIVTEPGAPLVVAGGKNFGYSNCLFDVPGGVYTLNGDLYNAYTNILDGNDSLTLNHGELPLYTAIAGTGNVMDGNGTVTGEIIFLAPTAELTLAINGTIANNVLLNGGTLDLAVDMHMGNGALITGPGLIDMGPFQMKFGGQDIIMNTPLNFNSAGGQISLNSQLSLASTWTITGNCTIQGNGNTLDLGTSGQIVINAGSTLCLQDVTLKNVGNTNIKCVDTAGVLILDDVIWSQPSYDYTFAQGALIIKETVTMGGGREFAYTSQQTSTINSYALWHFESDMDFSYAPTSTAQNLIAFADDTATLSFFETALNVSSVGLKLIKGTLVFDGICPVNIAGTTSSTGLILGDGISAANDINIVVMPESNLSVVSGYLNYQNVE